MTPMSSKRQCMARTKAGGPCQRWAIYDQDVCQAHRDYPTPLPDWNAPKGKPKRDPQKGGAPIKFDDALQAKACELASTGLSAEHVAAGLGISRRTLMRRIQADPEFREKWDEAYDNVTEAIEAKLVEMALQGHYPAIVTTLKARKPEVYSEKQGGVNVLVGGHQPQVAVLGEGDQIERIKALASKLSPEKQRALGLPVEDAEVVDES